MELEIFFEAMFQLAMTYVARREAADYAKFIANVRGRISDWAVVRTPHPLPDHAGAGGSGCADTRVLFLSAAGPDGRPEEGATERDRGLRGRQGPPAVPHHQGRGAPRRVQRSGTTKLFMPSGQTLRARSVATCIASLACVSSEDFLGQPPWRLCIQCPPGGPRSPWPAGLGGWGGRGGRPVAARLPWASAA